MKLAIAGAVVVIIVAIAIGKVVQRRGEETEREELPHGIHGPGSLSESIAR